MVNTPTNDAATPGAMPIRRWSMNQGRGPVADKSGTWVTWYDYETLMGHCHCLEAKLALAESRAPAPPAPAATAGEVKRFGALSYLGASHPHLANYMTFGERPDGMYVLYEDYARTAKEESA